MLVLDLESHQKQLCFLLSCCKSLFVCVFAEMSLGCVSAKTDHLHRLLPLRTKSKLGDYKALVLHVADADQVPLLFAAFFLSV